MSLILLSPASPSSGAGVQAQNQAGASSASASTRTTRCNYGEQFTVRTLRGKNGSVIFKFSLTGGIPFTEWGHHLQASYSYRDKRGRLLTTTISADGASRLDSKGNGYFGAVGARKSNRITYEGHAFFNGISGCHIAGKA